MMKAIVRLASLLLVASLVAGVALAQSPAKPEAAALELLNSGRADEAARILSDIVRQNPQNAEAHHLLSRVYYSTEDWENAVRNGERATQLQADNSGYHLWLGRAYGSKADEASSFSAMGLARKTVAEFQKAVQLNPTDTRAKQDLAEFYIEAPGIVGGGKDKARALAEQSSNSDPTLAHWIRGRIFLKEKNLAEAEREYKESIASSGNAPSAILELARFYKWTGRPDDVQATVARAMASPKRRPIDLFTAAELLDGAGRNYPGAIQLLKTYLAGKTVEDGPAFRAYFLIGEMYEKSGDRNNAVAQYKAALALASNYRLPKNALKKMGASNAS
jgi:tetratricopeptide (TPR) repeat protein